MKERIKDINSKIEVNTINDFYDRDLTEKVFSEQVDYVIDAIDTFKSKIDLLESCVKRNIPVISSLGAGNRLDPTQLYTADISEIRPGKCYFAKHVINKLKKKDITKGLTVVFSTEKPLSLEKNISRIEIQTKAGENIGIKKITTGSSPFVPPVAGYIMAAHVVKSFITQHE